MQPSQTIQTQDATHFFEHVCPVILSAYAESSKKIGGRVAFRVLGEGGGDWLVDLNAAQVRPGLSDQFDVLLELELEDFGGLLSGNLDVQGALDDGRVRYNGDLNALVRFGAILEMAEG
ncbi:MAG: SCP2 sterol-binding domain-containing protein [Myxococcota bacterium]